ncbi:MFS transporter [Arthrobacter sp. NPDC089319]|uniref:MFS transporter n=1 Tax=Arthrobacter sp. NPDC089319 TaxID=3155915 RepID=UPI00341C1913
MTTQLNGSNRRLFSPWATTACCAAMTGLGLLWAAYGPAIPQLQEQFGIDKSVAGLPFAIQSACSVVGALSVQMVLRRFGYRAAFGGAFLALGIGALIIGTVPAWSAILTGAVLAGLGLGCCDTLVSQAFITGQGRRGAAMVNIAHGCFGVGTVLAPGLLAVLGAERWSLMFLVVACLMLFAVTGVKGIASWKEPKTVHSMKVNRGTRPVQVWVIAGFLVLYIAHFGVQSGIGTWEPTRLMDQGHSEIQATLAVSGYWLAMVLGRVAAIPFTARFRPSSIVIVSSAGMTLALFVAVVVPDSAVWAYLLAGLMIGPIFPTGLTWLMTSGYARGGTFSYVVASALAGSIFLPPLLGILFQTHGSDALAPTVLAVSVVTVAATILVARLLRPAHESKKSLCPRRQFPREPNTVRIRRGYCTARRPNQCLSQRTSSRS